ncbi:MAG: right-handed parallel beta-helix repeat-containing protein [Kiritimatiellales bacterium]|nr:right-handed parallel beta-helix repeat-containing protein [Kiritimatiellales bacterium]MCF7863436.1 right-handed parallel beta-helix repeat-containing protein [Kiritimatiellales bacterium]
MMNFRKTIVVACVSGLSGLLVTGCVSKSPEQTVFTIEEFGAVGDGVHDDVLALKDAFRAMKAVDGKATLVFSKKTYRLGKQTESDAQFDFSGMGNVVVDGQGATLIVNPVHGLARMFNSRNIIFRNFTIQHDPLPFMQGEILSVSPDEGFFLWKVQTGFPLPPSEQWMQQDGNFFDDPAKGLPDRAEWDLRHVRSSWCWGIVMEAGEKTLKKDFVDHLFVETVVPAGTGDERVYRVSVIDSYKVHLSAIVAGERFVLPRFRRTAEEYFALKDKGWMFEQNVQIRKSADILVENLTFYSVRPGMVFGVRHNEGQITIRGCTVTWLPGTDRLIASWRDGVHCKNNRIGPTIENCHFEGLFDDSINMSADAFMSEKVLAPDRVVLTGAAFEAGDQVGVLYPTTGVWETGISVVEADERTVVFSRPVEQVVAGTMTPRKDIAATQFYNLSRANDGFVVRNNFFGIQRRHAVLARCSNGVIENNVIQGVCGCAVELSNETGSFYEGPFPRGLIIRNNRISGTPRTPIVMRTMSAPGAPSAAPVTGNILFENNAIVFDGGAPVQLTCVEDVVFKGNVFSRTDGSLIPEDEAVKVDPASRNIQFR